MPASSESRLNHHATALGNPWQFLRPCLVVFASLVALLSPAWAKAKAAEAPFGASIQVQDATLMVGGREIPVRLPHALPSSDTAAEGTRVRYRILVSLASMPHQPLGIYIGKLSLSGALYLNGALVETCAYGEIERLRCLHRPLLFTPTPALWKVGDNVIEIDVYGNHRQPTGLAAVIIDDRARLFREHFAPRLWWTVTLRQWLAYTALMFGLLALGIGLSDRDEPAYLWSGMFGIMNGIGGINTIASESPFSPAVVSWLIAVVQIAGALMFLLTCVALFKRHRTWQIHFALGYSAIFALLAYVLDTPHWLVIAAYVPVSIIAILLLVLCVRWAMFSRDPKHASVAAMLAVLFTLGLSDWLKFIGSSFEQVLLFPYGLSASILLIGLLLLTQLAASLRRVRALSSDLEEQVVERTAELETALQTIRRMEQTALQLTESIPVGTYVLEVSTAGVPRFTFISRRWLDMLDLHREEVMADPTLGFRCVHPDDYDAFMEENMKVFSTFQPFFWEGRIVVRGETRWLNVESIPRMLPDGSAAFEGVMVDVTKYKEAQSALKDAYERLTEAAIQNSRNEEREQLLQDMHDGFGSQLASARLMAEQGLISANDLPIILQECMSDLYLVTDTLNHSTNTLIDALADMKFRTQRRTEGLPVKILWDIGRSEAPWLSPRTILQILRIVQEAINNALKHAHAATISISVVALVDRQSLRVKIGDDGVGFPERPKYGRGVRNMQDRARSVSGILAIVSTSPGTCVELLLETTEIRHVSAIESQPSIGAPSDGNQR